MDLMQSFDAILFPADGRPPHVVSLMTSPASFSNPHVPAQTSTARIPHPEVHMEYIAEDPNIRAWYFQFVEALDMMNKKFANPYIIYYPVVSRDGMPFPANRTVRDIQEEMNKGRRLGEDQLWRGNLVVAKFADDRFTQMMDASMADFPILKNFLGTHPSPSPASSGSGALQTTLPTLSTTHPSPPPLPALPAAAAALLPPPPHHHHHHHYPANLPVLGSNSSAVVSAARQMQFAEQPTSGLPQTYEREPSTHGVHGVPVGGMPMGVAVPAGAPRRDPKTQHQHHQQQPPMEL
ncbi:hypothetical protein BJV74DRAFT_796376 [Russula compacta]|nr:hypothetical protein BJV74DRAFT_796376 [Russula compacta]